MDPTIKAQIDRAISSNDVILFMKGTRQTPSCGFSARTVEVLDNLLGDYAHVDVLAHPEIRDGIKEYSSWPTIPQLYVRGQFVGGADIILELFESGQLHATLGLPLEESVAPSITVTERAAEAFKGFVGDSGEVVLLEIDRAFSPRLSVGPAPERALLSQSRGVTIATSQLTAARAEGVTIDYIETADGLAFRIDNPQEPAKVRQMSVESLAQRRAAGESPRLIDVRTPSEWATARIDGAELLDADLMDRLSELPKSTPLIFVCHHGHRSQRVAEQLISLGFSEIYNLRGGIDAWSQEIDPAVPRY